MSKLENPAALPLLAALAIAAAPAHADWRCDCTRITGSCEASVELNGGSVQIRSDQRACSRVEYYLDGQPFVALVVDGERREQWGANAQSPEVLVQSCQLCADQLETGDGGAAPRNGERPAATTTTQAAPAPSPETPLIQVAPAWPAGVQAASGEVTVELNVGADGAVKDARVLEAKPRGVFDQAALDAVRRWRYAQGEARTLKERVAFEAPAQNAGGGSAAPGPRNACVREGNVDDLVDIVQVQLINACSEAVLVRTCAVGFAEHAQQWVCDGQPLALVMRGDALNGLLGETTTDRGRMRFGYAEESYLSRPAGSRYAWIACAVEDADCNGSALRWTEYLNAKPSDVDPGAGSDVAVAVAR